MAAKNDVMDKLVPTGVRTSLFTEGDEEPVGPAMHYQSLTNDLLKTLSGSPERPALVILGCGSVGSKLTMHAVRSGQTIVALADQASIRPHNLARHALGANHVAENKAEALAEELASFHILPATFTGDLSIGLRDVTQRKAILPRSAGGVINTTASLSVREALVATADKKVRARLFEAALFGRGRGALLLVDGKEHNPSHSDLMAELYATVEDQYTSRLLFNPDEGLAQIQIGQGCGSLTMPIDDARLSMMTAGLFPEINHALDQPVKAGVIVVGATDGHGPSTSWQRQIVPPFETVKIAGSDGWQLRIRASGGF